MLVNIYWINSFEKDFRTRKTCLIISCSSSFNNNVYCDFTLFPKGKCKVYHANEGELGLLSPLYYLYFLYCSTSTLT